MNHQLHLPTLGREGMGFLARWDPSLLCLVGFYPPSPWEDGFFPSSVRLVWG